MIFYKLDMADGYVKEIDLENTFSSFIEAKQYYAKELLRMADVAEQTAKNHRDDAIAIDLEVANILIKDVSK